MSDQTIPRRMRAAVITKPRTCELKVVDTPTPSAQQVLVRVEGCGVCGSNLPMWEGREWFNYPTGPGTPGHEGWGQIVALGGKVDGFAVGDRVAFLSGNAFAEYDVASTQSLVALPAMLDGRDVPGEPLGCAINIWRRSEIAAGQTVAVVGVGFLGALLVQIASRSGARVIAVSQRPWSLELARTMGAIEALPMSIGDAEIVGRVEQLTSSQGCDCVIELTGLQPPLDLAAKLCRVRGRLVIAGFHQDGLRSVDMFLWNWRGLDVINAHERDVSAYVSGMSAAIDQVTSAAIEPESLYTHRVPLERAGEAFELLRTRPDGFVKALVTP